ncbi:hypothetical protein CTEN210_02778 [Chaetoceros tenuissimus]|uniref:G-protein coupled receptors family 1 profile domain-containing protein n=1 Tax=Chaetoceros tenuissimus TaxID=426638 RepID=A0AAD3CK92_9STRA|nr:hypothetical protein CTEN210_02778 [Chaetoceros tenuissimus]
MFFSASMQAAMIIRCIMGGISTVSSSLLLFFIYCAPKGLQSPYSRIIFGLSLADVLQSLGVLLGPFAAPKDPLNIFGIGNIHSCEAIGFLTIIGFLAVPWYTLHLTYYFLKRVKYKVKPTDFANGEEKWIHILIWTYSISAVTYALVKGQINATKGGNMCVISDSPVGCEKTPNQECERGEGANTTNIATAVASLVTVFIALFLVLGAFTLHVYFSEKQLQPSKEKQGKLTSLRKRPNKEFSKNESEEKKNEEITEFLSSPDPKMESMQISLAIEESKNDVEEAKQQDQEREVKPLSKHEQEALDLVLTKSAVAQSSLYIFAFMIVYLGPIIALVSGYNQNTLQVVFWWTSIFYPCGGVFNILIYTRPKVQAVKKSIPLMPRIICFLIVLLSGGETPNLMDIMASPEQNFREQQLSERSATNYGARLAVSYGFPENANLEAEIERAMREMAVEL